MCNPYCPSPTPCPVDDFDDGSTYYESVGSDTFYSVNDVTSLRSYEADYGSALSQDRSLLGNQSPLGGTPRRLQQEFTTYGSDSYYSLPGSPPPPQPSPPPPPPTPPGPGGGQTPPGWASGPSNVTPPPTVYRRPMNLGATARPAIQTGYLRSDQPPSEWANLQQPGRSSPADEPPVMTRPTVFRPTIKKKFNLPPSRRRLQFTEDAEDAIFGVQPIYPRNFATSTPIRPGRPPPMDDDIVLNFSLELE